MKVCENCKYYSPYEDGDSIGECRRYPPRIFVIGQDRVKEGCWPDVVNCSWCGEFEQTQT